MTSSYDSTGVTLDRYADIVTRLVALAEAQWSDGINTDEDEFLGHIIRNLALLLGETNEVVQEVYDAISVLSSTGSQLDNLVELIGLERSAAAYSTVTLTLTATAATTVPAGSQYATDSEVIFETDSQLVFAAAGSDTVAATCSVTGANEAAAGTITTIKTPVYGISASTNVSAAVPGRDRETDAELRTRHTTAVATSGNADGASLFEAISAVSGVSSTYVYDNDTNETIGVVPAHTIRVSVVGGTDAAVATAIDDNKTVGVATYGATSVDVYNTTTKQTKTIKFDRATTVPVHIQVSINTISGIFPDDGEAQIKAALVTHFDDIEINADVVYNALYKPIYSVAGHTVTSLLIGITDPPTGTSDLSSDSLTQYTLATANIDII